MKKLIVLAIAAGAGYLIFRKIQQDRAEQDLWNEAVADLEAGDAPVVDLR